YTAHPAISSLSLHDALPILAQHDQTGEPHHDFSTQRSGAGSSRAILPCSALSALRASLTPAERTPGGFVGQPVCSEELFAQREVLLVGCCQVAAGAKFRTDELGKRCHIRLA